MQTVFISYSRIEQLPGTQEKISNNLQRMRQKVLFDTGEVSGGERWWEKIINLIEESDVLLYIIDEYSIDSSYCKAELSYAEALNLYIIPVMISKRSRKIRFLRF